MHAQYRDRAEFLMIYIREAHAADEWVTPDNPEAGISIIQPTSFSEREDAANLCDRALDIHFSILVDAMNDQVNKLYGAWPERMYVLDADGTVIYQGDYGPWGFKPDDVETALKELLN